MNSGNFSGDEILELCLFKFRFVDILAHCWWPFED